MIMNAISIKNLHKSYPNVTALRGISFDIEAGDFFGFLGPNGAGKTTTINCIIGLANFSLGNISVFGKDVIKDYKEARKLIGVAPQEYNFDPYLNIKDVLIYQAGYYGIRKKYCEARAEELLKQFNLNAKQEVDFRKLSGGMKRRLTLARALIHDPKVLILDEPTAGVDVELRIDLHRYLEKINKQGTNDKTKNLVNNLDTGHTEIVTDKASDEIKLNHVEFHGKKIIVWNRGREQLKKVFAHLQKQKINILDIKSVKDSLQDIFLRLTKK